MDPSQALRVDEACDRFEAAWRAGQGPRIEDYLASAAVTDHAELLRCLVKLELELRARSGDQARRDEYERRFPNDAELLSGVFPLPPTLQDTGPYTPGADSVPVEPSARPGTETCPPVPTKNGRYKVQRYLGGGTFGDVWLAHDEVLDRQVAIKVPSARLLATRRAKEEFVREARIVARLEHPGIVKAYDFDEENGTCYIVYEYVDGVPLAERMQTGVAHTEAAAIIRAVSEALHHAHVEGLVHRDIKPDNILIDRKGRPRVADFGLAVREEDLPRERGRLAGTYPYMSPEQVRREGNRLDGRTDIYSLGVVLYELLCGRRPFQGETEEELEDEILNREAKPPRQIKDSIPAELERICLKALSKRIQDRYTTARDMAAEVAAALERMSRRDEPPLALTPEEVEERMASADEADLQRLLRYLQKNGDPAFVPMVFRCLSHPVETVRRRARKVLHSLGWNKVSSAAEELARRDEAAGITAVLDGLAAFEAHPEVVALLDKLALVLKGDLRNRAILLLERKRLGVELDAVADLFRAIHSPYRIEKALGQGLFTAAYLARAEGTELAVVVRLFRSELVGQASLRADFLDLSKRALLLVHENLVVTREVRSFPERNIYFAVRDYVDGVPLQKLLEGGKRFEPAQIVRLLQQLLAALAAVHRRGMCHGGVKPSNVFVCADNRVVLGDPSLPVQGIVALERLSYDYRYAAPESFRSGATVGAQADFYALGCVAYELACGQPPFVSDNYLELAGLHLHATVEPPSRRGSRLGPAGDEVLQTLLARSPGDRYARAEDVLRALEAVEASWLSRGRSAAPLLRDASLMRFRGTESVLGFDASAASLRSEPEDTGYPVGAAPAPVPEQPSRIGTYEILKTLGRGGMGVVYQARDPRLERIVALKVLRAGLRDEAQRLADAVSGEQLARFLTEARAVARLQHPGIVQIYEIGEHEGMPYLALEFVGGGSVADRIRTQRISHRDAAVAAAKVARAVHHAHEAGVLHRDLKPSNILLTPDGEPKIADFGLAKMQDLTREDQANQTISGIILGTPSYMAPEQAAGKVKEIGPTTDIFSLGAILYEALTSRPPFRGASPFETLARLATEPLVPPHKLDPAVSRDLSAICTKCLEKDPKDRYGSALALAEDLERWLAGSPIVAAGPSLWSRARSLAARPWEKSSPLGKRRPSGWKLLACAAALGMVLLGIIWLLWLR
jgi:serine/threonine protein kinase